MRVEQLSEKTAPLKPEQIIALDKAIDKMFQTLGIDIVFTRHFFDRVNDPRNEQQITLTELGRLFVKEYNKWGKQIAKLTPKSQALLKDFSSNINIPFVIRWDSESHELDLVAKTIMRKKNFKHSDREFAVETTAGGVAAVSGGIGDGDPAASIYGSKRKKRKGVMNPQKRMDEAYEYKQYQQNNIYKMTFSDAEGNEAEVKITEVSHDEMPNNHRWVIQPHRINYADKESVETVMSVIRDWTYNLEYLPKRIQILFNVSNHDLSEVFENWISRSITTLAKNKGMKYHMRYSDNIRRYTLQAIDEDS